MRSPLYYRAVQQSFRQFVIWLEKCNAAFARGWQLALLGVCCAASNAGAIEVSGLYTVDVDYPANTATARRDAFRDALRQVIGRVTDRSAADPASVATVVEQAERLVTGYRDGGNNRLWVSFNGRALTDALRASGIPVWGSDRPLTIVWLAVDRGGGERAILSSSDRYADGARARRADPADYLRERLEKAAAERGLPVVLPLMDAEDQQRIAFADVWGGFADVMSGASERYGAVSRLSGRVRSDEADTIRWTWRFSGNEVRFTGNVETAMARLGRDMAAALSVADPNDVRRMALAISDVRDVATFGQLLRFLERQPLVRQVDVLAMDNAMASLELAYIGGEAQIVQLLDSFAALEPVANPGFMVGGTNPLDEGLTPPRGYRLRR
ncbi:MAG: DUF2066 domain-containing protein [Pseudomonadota bacterium]